VNGAVAPLAWFLTLSAAPSLSNLDLMSTIGNAGVQGDIETITKLSGAGVSEYVSPPSRQTENRTVAQFAKLVRNCKIVEKYEAKSPVPEGGQEGSVYWGCAARPIADKECVDEGYALIAYRAGDQHRLVYWRHDRFDSNRCPGRMPVPSLPSGSH